MIIGVISDTHGLLRAEVFDRFRYVSAIIHAGDIGSDEILTELGTVAPVYAVYGNTDGFPLVEKLPESRLLEFEQVSIFVTHIGGTPQEMRSRYPQAREARVLIFGHSHKPLQQDESGTLFFNPGSAGPRRFSLPVTAGRLMIDGSSVASEIVSLV